MTTLAPEKRKCFICGATNTYRIVTSTNAFGPTDLDTRPPRMQRDTMPYWIQSCPSCGYVSRKISDRTSVSKDFLGSEQYCSCNGIRFTSNLARNFYRQHLIQLKENKEDDAFYALLRSSWACDDMADTHNAVLVREKAVKLADELLAGPEAGNETLSLIRADMMRRSGHFKELLDKYKDTQYSEELLDQILAYEKVLARRKSTECRTVQDALLYAAGNMLETPDL